VGISRLLQDSVVGLASRVGEGGLDVVRFKVGEVAQDVVLRGTAREAFEDVSHPNAHTPDARATAALVGLDRDALKELHTMIVPALARKINGRCAARD
jgi:hypothetical protein